MGLGFIKRAGDCYGGGDLYSGLKDLYHELGTGTGRWGFTLESSNNELKIKTSWESIPQENFTRKEGDLRSSLLSVHTHPSPSHSSHPASSPQCPVITSLLYFPTNLLLPSSPPPHSASPSHHSIPSSLTLLLPSLLPSHSL